MAEGIGNGSTRWTSTKAHGAGTWRWSSRPSASPAFRFLAEDVCEDLASVLDGIQYNWGNRA